MPVLRPKVFISYSHDSPEHRQRVLALAERLRQGGVDAQIDQYVAGTPQEGWPRWMLDRLDWADFVLAVCTETYYTRFRGHEEPGKGKGVDWEGQLVTLAIYHTKSRTERFVPVLFEPDYERFIPEPISGHTHYLLSSEDNYAKLYAFLTGQAGVTPGELGALKTLARNPVEPLRFDISDPPARRTIHNLPFPPNPLFTGREAELEALRRGLQQGRTMAVTQTMAVHGLGGVGKTQLAVEYAWKHLGDYDAACWAKADSPAALDASLAALAPVLGLREAGEHEQAVQTKAVLDWLNNHERWLLIADNADTDAAARAARDRFPPTLVGHILITSRVSRWPVTMPHLPLDMLSGEDAARYLLDRVAKENLNAGDKASAQSLAEELGNLPLALEQAGSFIVEMRWSFAKYQEQFRNARLELLSEHREGGTHYPASVAKTWSITLEKLSPLARVLLRMAAWFAPHAIPREIFSADKEVLSEVLTEQATLSDLAIEKALAELDRFSLVRLTSETVSVHRMLQAVEQDSLPKEDWERWLIWTARLFNAFAPGSPGDARTWDVWLPLGSHAEALLGYTKRHVVETLPIALMANQFGLFLLARGAYGETEPVFRRALAIRQKALGLEHPDVAASLDNLANLYRVQGRYAEAERLFTQALPIWEKALGREHPEVATCLTMLALLYGAQGRYAEAEPLHRRALQIRQKALGSEHSEVAASLDHLADLYRVQGRYAEAEPLFTQALPVWEKALGREHPEVAICLTMLALLYGAQGRYAEAEPLHRRALQIRQKALGPEHSEVAASLDNLANLYRVQGRYAEAEPLFTQALPILEKALGREHPEVATCLTRLALLYGAQGRYAEAEPLHRRALQIRQKALGPEHSEVAASLDNLADLYRVQGRYAEAEPLFTQALPIWEKALGREHPEVAICLTMLALLYGAQGRYAEAEPLHRRALQIRQKALGPEHPDVAASVDNLANLYRAQGRYAEAEPLHRRGLQIRQKALGPEHPDVAASLDNLADLYRAQGRYAEAEPLFTQALPILEKALGREHPEVATCLTMLALLYGAQGRYTEAEPLHTRALQIRQKALGPEHPDVATVLESYSFLLRAMGRPDEAYPLEARARAIRAKRA